MKEHGSKPGFFLGWGFFSYLIFFMKRRGALDETGGKRVTWSAISRLRSIGIHVTSHNSINIDLKTVDIQHVLSWFEIILHVLPFPVRTSIIVYRFCTKQNH